MYKVYSLFDGPLVIKYTFMYIYTHVCAHIHVYAHTDIDMNT